MADQDLSAKLNIDATGLEETADAASKGADELARMAAEEEKYQRTLAARIALMERQKRLQEDLVKGGHIADPAQAAAERHEASKDFMGPATPPEIKARQEQDRSNAQTAWREQAATMQAAKQIAAEKMRRAKQEAEEENAAAKRGVAERKKEEAKQTQEKRQTALDTANRWHRVAAVGHAAASGGTRGLLGAGLSALGPEGAAINAGLSALEGGLQAATKAANVMGDQGLTGLQKQAKLYDEFVPFAKSIREFREAVDGTTEALRQQELTHNKLSLMQQGGAEIQTFRNERAFQGAALQNRADVLGGVRLPGAPQFDRSTVQGERERAEYLERQGPADAKIRADAELAAARRNAASAEKVQADAAKNLAQKDLEAKNAKDAYDREALAQNIEDREGRIGAISKALSRTTDGRSQSSTRKRGDIDRHVIKGEERARMLAEQARLVAERDKINSDPNGAKTRLDSTGKLRERTGDAAIAAGAENTRQLQNVQKTAMELAQKEAEARMANISALKTEASILGKRADLMRSQNQRVGSMSPVEFQANLNALKIVTQSRSLDSLPTEFINRARQIAPETIAKMEEARGGGQREQIRAVVPKEFREGRQADLDEAAAKTAEVARQAEMKNITANAQRVATLFQKGTDILADALEKQVGALGRRMARLEDGVAAARAQGG